MRCEPPANPVHGIPPALSQILAALVIVFLTSPWLTPYTAGPTPNAWPLLFSAFCAFSLCSFGQRLTPRLVATGWIAAAAISSLIALVQYFGLAHVFANLISQTQAGEAFGNLRQRNQFATLTSIGLLALLVFALRVGALQKPTTVRWAVAVILLLALGNAASSSRTGLLQWMLVGAMMLCWQVPGQRRQLVLTFGALVAYLVAVIALPVLLSATTGLSGGGLFGRLVASTGCSSRMILWSNVLTLIGQKPWFGWGWGELDYAHFMTMYAGPRFCEILDNAHNLPLHLAVELGIPVAVLACGGMGWLVWRCKPWQEKDSARQLAWGVLAVIMLHSLLEYPLWYGPFQIAVGLSVCILWRTRPEALTDRSDRHDNKAGFVRKIKLNLALAQWLKPSLAIISIALLAFVSVSYYRVSQVYLPPEQRSPAYRTDTLNKIKDTWLFRKQMRFAELSLTPLTRANALQINAMAKELLHYSPEARVAEKVVESAVMLGQDDEALMYLARFRAAFPAEHALWAASIPHVPE